MNEREKKTVSKMIGLYCRLSHQEKSGLCTHCLQLENYAHQQLENCLFKERKPTCRKCTIHCYKPEYRQRIQQVMRFSGPRMLLYYPTDTIRHLILMLFK